MTAKNRVDFTGQRIGYWEILNLREVIRRDKRHYNTVWDAKCHKCGMLKTVSSDSLRAGSKNCFDCRDIGYTDPQEATYKKLYRKAKYKNKQLKEVAHLDYAKFKELLKANCHYCNSEPSNSYGTRVKDMKSERNIAAELIYSGIDRIDNSKGYIEGNVVSCCKRCNIAKSSSTHEEFAAWIKQLVQYQLSLKLV